MDLWWRQDGDYEYLYAGCHDLPVAFISPSASGKQYTFLMEVPVNTIHWKRYMPKEELKLAVEKGVRDFFGLANTHRPAMDRPE